MHQTQVHFQKAPQTHTRARTRTRLLLNLYTPTLLERFSQAPPNRASTFRLIYNPEVQAATLKCLFTAGMKQTWQLGLEVKAPNGLL